MSMRQRVLVQRYVHPDAFRRTVIAVILAEVAMLAMTGVSFYKQLHLAATGLGNHASLLDDIRIYGTSFVAPALVLLIIPMLFVMKRQVIRVDERGLRFENHVGVFAAILAKPWSIRWSEIRAVDWRFNRQQPHLSQLVLHTAQERRVLAPWMWPDAAQPLPKRPFNVNVKAMSDRILSQLSDMPLVQAIETARPDLGLGAADPAAKPGQSLGQGLGLTGVTPLTGLIAATMGFGVIYFIVEVYFTLSEFYVSGPPWAALVAVAVIASLLIYVLLGAVEPKRNDSAIYALLFALAVGFIAYPLSIRISVWTAPGAEIAGQYELGKDYVWHPKGDTSLPPLHLYLQGSRWWRQFKPGDTHTFDVRRGGLGRWLVDMGRVYREQKAFYRCHGPIDCMGGGHRSD